MPRLVQPRPDPDVSNPLHVDLFRRCGFDLEAFPLAVMCRAVGLDAEDPLDPLRDEQERVVEYVAADLRRRLPANAPLDVVMLLGVYSLQRALHQGFRCWQPDESRLLEIAVGECGQLRTNLSESLHAAMEIVQPNELKAVTRALFVAGLVDPLYFIDIGKLRTEPQREEWNDLRLPAFWLALDPTRAFEAFHRCFEAEPVETLGALALGLQRQLLLSGPGMRVARKVEMRELYPLVEPLTLVLCKRHDGRFDDLQLTESCWRYARLMESRAPSCLGALYEPLLKLAYAELENVRRVLRGSDAAAWMMARGDYLGAAVFFAARTSSDSIWPTLRRLLLALREIPERGVPLDLRTWDEPGFSSPPRPWNIVIDHIARLLETTLALELTRDSDLDELRREFAKFCLDRIKTREKARSEHLLTDKDFFEPHPKWRAAYINAARELHPNLGERGHHVVGWSRDHDPDEEVRETAKSSFDVIRHGRGLPKNMSPRRAMFAAFWWLRQAHVVSLGGCVDEAGSQRTFAKEMRRQASLEK
ncbi:MAG TPA: hypothetical protein VLB44_02835 [Kofleriaceae bacterium]|nr:hypothetical protein [Kofleriaceae bacterium]